MGMAEAPSTKFSASTRFRSVIRDELVPMQFESELQNQRTSALAGIRTGVVDVLRYSGVGEQWGGRDEQLILADGADYYVLCAPTAARLEVQQNGYSVALRQGYFTLVSTRRPFSARISPEADAELFSAIHVRFPGSLLRRVIPCIDDLCGRAVAAAPGNGRLLLSLFELALSEGPHLSPIDRNLFGQRLLDLFSGAIESIVAAADQPCPKVTACQRVVEAAKTYIALHLGDPDLGPARIAMHCGVSTRFLHLSFSAQSEQTVMQLIRESRLLACQKALSDPANRRRTVTQIAGELGLDDPSQLCRLYKSRFGRTPREERIRETATIN